MRITQITVSCGSTIPHPKQAYSSIREDVSVTALLAEGEQPGPRIRALQEWLEPILARRLLERMEKDL